MKFGTNFFQGKPESLEEGPAKYRSTNEYYVLHRDERITNCGKIVQIVKVILCIELIILIGWLGYVSFSYYNTDRNTDCGVSAIGSKASEIDYDDLKMKNSRERRSLGDTAVGREMCERNANETRRRLDSFAAQFVTGESSDPTVVQLRRNFTILTMFESHQVIITNFLMDILLTGLTDDNGTTNTNLLSMIPNDGWQRFMGELREEFINSTDSQTRQRLAAPGPSTGEMTSEFRAITESFYIDVRYCNMLLLDSLFSVFELNRSDEAALRSKRASERKSSESTQEINPAAGETPTRDRRFVKKRFVTADPIPETDTVTCWNGEHEPALLAERRARLLALAVENATDKLELHEQHFLRAIETALNATSTSEIHFAERYTRPRMMLTAMEYLTSNASLELHKDGYEIIRDLFLELRKLNKNSPEWKGWNADSILANVTVNIDFDIGPSAQSIFNNFIRIGESFNLHYVELRKKDNGADPYQPAFGEFTYGGEQPEAVGIWHMKHILDGFVKFYFKIQDPSGMCNSTAESHVEAGEDSTSV